MPNVVLVGQSGQHHLQPVLLHYFHDFQRKVVRVVEQLDWAGLEEDSFEVLHIFGVADHDHVDSDFQKRVANEVVVL